LRPGDNAVIESGIVLLNPAAASGSVVRPHEAATGCEVDTRTGADQMTGSDLVLKKLEPACGVASNVRTAPRSSVVFS